MTDPDDIPRHPQGWLVARVAIETTEDDDQAIAELRRLRGLPPAEAELVYDPEGNLDAAEGSLPSEP